MVAVKFFAKKEILFCFVIYLENVDIKKVQKFVATPPPPPPPLLPLCSNQPAFYPKDFEKRLKKLDEAIDGFTIGRRVNDSPLKVLNSDSSLMSEQPTAERPLSDAMSPHVSLLANSTQMVDDYRVAFDGLALQGQCQTLTDLELVSFVVLFLCFLVNFCGEGFVPDSLKKLKFYLINAFLYILVFRSWEDIVDV